MTWRPPPCSRKPLPSATRSWPNAKHCAARLKAVARPPRNLPTCTASTSANSSRPSRPDDGWPLGLSGQAKVKALPALTLCWVNDGVYRVLAGTGLHVGNLKLLEGQWKFKAIGYGAHGEVIPG